MINKSRPTAALAVGLVILSVALLAWSYWSFVVPFRAASGGRELLDARFAGYDSGDVVGMLEYLRNHADAAAIQRGLYLGPELLLPAAVATLLFLLLKGVGTSGEAFGRPIPRIAALSLLAVPFLYALADYAENVAGLMLFPPASPSDALLAALSSLLPVLARLKFAALAIAIILLVRAAILRYLSERSEELP